jgi:proline iminopeptidase
MIPIQTPMENLKFDQTIWNQPKIKILLLHGGPAMTHEYMECFETFFKEKDLNFMNTIS